jgi:Putative metallopeptidase
MRATTARTAALAFVTLVADPDATGDVVAQGLLTEDRAERCADEYQKLDRAWSRLLDPYLK